MNAATLVCIRSSRRYPSSFQVLLGQNEVINWLKSSLSPSLSSSSDSLSLSLSPSLSSSLSSTTLSSSISFHMMRYPGEWKFPGGGYEESDGRLERTALRELQEEFLGIFCPIHEIEREMSLFNIKQTLPVKGREYMMYNYLVIDELNRWSDEEIERVNERLQRRKSHFFELLSDGSYWELDQEEKSEVSPEVHRIQWIEIDDAIKMMKSAHSPSMCYVDDWQRSEFEKYGVRQRDPMYQSMMVLKEIREFSSLETLKHHLANQRDIR